MTDYLFTAWLKECETQVSWFSGRHGMSEDTLRLLYEKYPGKTLDEIALLAIQKKPEAFEELGVTINGQPPTEYLKHRRLQ